MKITLKAARINADMTRKQVGEALGVTAMCVGLWERGKTKPSMSAKILMSQMYKISLDDIIFPEVFK